MSLLALAFKYGCQSWSGKQVSSMWSAGNFPALTGGSQRYNLDRSPVLSKGQFRVSSWPIHSFWHEAPFVHLCPSLRIVIMHNSVFSLWVYRCVDADGDGVIWKYVGPSSVCFGDCWAEVVQYSSHVVSKEWRRTATETGQDAFNGCHLCLDLFRRGT